MPPVAALLHVLPYQGPMLLHWLVYQPFCVSVSLELLTLGHLSRHIGLIGRLDYFDYIAVHLCVTI